MSPEDWVEARRTLARRDAVLRRMIRKHRDAEFASRGDAFQALARSIVGQQISVAAAQSIWARFNARVGRMTPANVVALADADLRTCGLSPQKLSYIRDLAGRFHTGEVKPRRWARMDDEAVIEDLTQVKGIGRWSAQMFLIFHLQRPDVLPVGDLGLQRAMERAYNDGEPLTREQMAEIGRAWQPWCSVATWYLWRSLESAP
jgi:DNA-3-methyladenine glycosylase II